MAVDLIPPRPVTSFEDWYVDYRIDDRDGSLDNRSATGPLGQKLWSMYMRWKSEMEQRTTHYHKLEKLADGSVITPKPDLPNISSGETAGLVRRIARNLVQNTPNVEVISKFNDDSAPGIFNPLISPTGRKSTTNVCWVIVLMKRVAATRT